MDSTTIFYLVVLASFAGLYKIFERAGEKGWKALIPFYNFYVWLMLLQRPKWWLVFFFIPGVNALMFAILMFQTAYAFGKRSFFHLMLASFGCFFYAHYLGFYTENKENKWLGANDFHNLKNGFIKSWLDPIFFAIVAASIIRTFFLEAFTIPTASLEKSLLVGDFLFVNKLSYGSRVPITPLAFPLAHHTIPLINSKAYLDFWKLPYMRLPGYKKIKNSDIVVFNYPDGDTVGLNWQDRSYYNECRRYGFRDMNNDTNALYTFVNQKKLLSIGAALLKSNPQEVGLVQGRPIDKREHYVKRCVAIAGDKLEIKDGIVFINNKELTRPEHLQHNYYMICDPEFVTNLWLDQNNVNLDEIYYLEAEGVASDSETVCQMGQPISRLPLGDAQDKVPNINSYINDLKSGKYTLYRINLEDKKAIELKNNSAIKYLEIRNEKKNEFDLMIFPHSPKYPWNNDNFGPFVLPKAGVTVQIDVNNICLYYRIIDVYEDNDLIVEGSKIFINGVIATQYTFKQDYYWMMGDNRHNSADSRSWGYVPFDHIVGTPVFVWFSLKYNDKQAISGKWSFKTIFANEQNGKLRWSRFFCFVSDKGLSKSYFSYFLILAGLWFGISKYLAFRKKKDSVLNQKSK